MPLEYMDVDDEQGGRKKNYHAWTKQEEKIL